MRETAKTYLAATSARFSCFSPEDMRGREKAEQGSKIQHFHSSPPSGSNKIYNTTLDVFPR